MLKILSSQRNISDDRPKKIPESRDSVADADTDSPVNWESANSGVTDNIEEILEVVVKGTSEFTSNVVSPEASVTEATNVDLSTPVDLSYLSKADEDVLRDESKTKLLDQSRIVSEDEYREGKSKVSPLAGGRLRGANNFSEKPKFFDGKLARSVERGVPYPQPGKLVYVSLLVLLNKFTLLSAIIILPLSLFLQSTLFGLTVVLPVMIVFFVVGTLHFLATHRTRCRVCSCHFFRIRRCDKHRLSHFLPLIGYTFAAALHLILYKWMRCMYCGTAIRLKQRQSRRGSVEPEDIEPTPDF